MSEKIKAIIVDDEERARDVLQNLIGRHCPSVQLIGMHSNVVEAVSAIKKQAPDVVFLDIEMPLHSGHEILDFFDDVTFEIIFVTAYDSYAVKAFEVAAIDYLLKPIDIERLKEAVEKLESKLAFNSMSKNFEVLKESLNSDAIKNLVLAEKGYNVVVSVLDIIAIEAQESYSKIYTAKKEYIASRNLKHFEGLLSDNKNFFRTHKSWIVNTDLPLKYNKTMGEIVLNQRIVAKLSKYRKEAFESLLGR